MKEFKKYFEMKLNDSIESDEIDKKSKGFKNTKDFEKFCIEINTMSEYEIKKIMGKEYIDTPGDWKGEKNDYDDVFDYMQSNMGKQDFNKLEDWWKKNVKK